MYNKVYNVYIYNVNAQQGKRMKLLYGFEILIVYTCS